MELQQETLANIGRRLRSGELSATALTVAALEAAQRHKATHAFISLNPAAMREAEERDRQGFWPSFEERPLEGIPISVKDNYDVAGLKTTAGSPFYASLHGEPVRDSAYATRWRQAGAIIVGKTHLNEFAYGLTGENQIFGSCLQPDDLTRLTGGSSSGAAASVQGGAACIGLGTDTGGSIRVPSALCGLIGFRHGLNPAFNRGLFPLAESFDTCGWLQKNLGDLRHVYEGLTQKKVQTLKLTGTRVAFLTGKLLDPCEAPIRAAFEDLYQKLSELGAAVSWQQATGYERAAEIFAAVQAYEAARTHENYLARPGLAYDPAIRARLEWGLSITREEYVRHRREMEAFNAKLTELWGHHDFLLLPSSAYSKLLAGEDHAGRRKNLLQLTAPFSVAGLPVLNFPYGVGPEIFGWQLAVPSRGEERLISIADSLAEFLHLA